MIRPEQLELSGGDAAFSARVVGISFHGHDATVRLQACSGGADSPELLARIPGLALPSLGETVAVSVRGEVVVYRGPQAGYVNGAG